MKLRIRFRRITKVYEINEEEYDSATVASAKEPIALLFQGIFDGEFQLSLNKKDILEDDWLIRNCNVVSGDLIHVIVPGNEQEEVGDGALALSPKSSIEEELPKASTASNRTTAYSTTEPQPGCSAAPTEDVTMASISEEIADNSMLEEEVSDPEIVRQCLSEPVLCREAGDGQVPAMLREMYEALEPQTETETLGVVLHVLMLETGFLIQDEGTGDNSANLPHDWRQSAYLKFTYTYPGCADVTCCLTVIPTGKSVTLHGKVVGSKEATRQCSLQSSHYVKRLIDGDCASCYRGLAKLSRLFKDSIANPLVQDIRTAAGLVDVFGLMALSQESKLRILGCLDVRSLLKVSRVNSQLWELCRDPFLWRRLYLKDFGGNRRDNSLAQDWKQIYIREYKQRRDRRKAMARMTAIVPPFWNPQNPFSGPTNWVPPVPGGIIGGDYDLYPEFPGGFPGGGMPGAPSRFGLRQPMLPRPRYDLIGPGPGVDPGPDLGFLPHRPNMPSRGRGRGGHPFGGFHGPRFL